MLHVCRYTVLVETFIESEHTNIDMVFLYSHCKILLHQKLRL